MNKAIYVKRKQQARGKDKQQSQQHRLPFLELFHTVYLIYSASGTGTGSSRSPASIRSALPCRISAYPTPTDLFCQGKRYGERLFVCSAQQCTGTKAVCCTNAACLAEE